MNVCIITIIFLSIICFYLYLSIRAHEKWSSVPCCNYNTSWLLAEIRAIGRYGDEDDNDDDDYYDDVDDNNDVDEEDDDDDDDDYCDDDDDDNSFHTTIYLLFRRTWIVECGIHV